HRPGHRPGHRQGHHPEQHGNLLLLAAPLLYALSTAFHPGEYSALGGARPSLDNFSRAWSAAPFARYFFHTFVLATLILACQLVLCTLAAKAFARTMSRPRLAFSFCDRPSRRCRSNWTRRLASTGRVKCKHCLGSKSLWRNFVYLAFGPVSVSYQ